MYTKELEILKSIPALHSFVTNWLKITKSKKVDIEIPTIFLTKYMDVDITEEIQAFGNILKQEGCVEFNGKKDIVFYNVKNLEEIDNIYNYFKALIYNYKKFSNEYKGILYLEISELDNLEDQKFDEFCEFINDFKDNVYFIFSYTKKDDRDESKKIAQKILNKVYIYNIDMELPNKVELFSFLKEYLEECDLKLYKNTFNYLEEVLDSYFMKDLDKTIYKYPLFLKEMRYYLLTNNRGMYVNRLMLKNAIENNKVVSSLYGVKENENKIKIGFCVENIGR